MSETQKDKTRNPDGKQMIAQFLREHQYDGLYSEECGCDLKDLMPCGGDWAMDCRAGYKVKGDYEFDGEKYDWAIRGEKQ